MRQSSTARALLGKWVRKGQPNTLERPSFKQLIRLVCPSPHKKYVVEAQGLSLASTFLQAITLDINSHENLARMPSRQLHQKQSISSANLYDIDCSFLPFVELKTKRRVGKQCKPVLLALTSDDELVRVYFVHNLYDTLVKMDKIIEKLLNATSVDEWLISNGWGLLVSTTAINLVSIVLGAIIFYYIGRAFIGYGIRHVIRQTAKQRAWHKKDAEKREKTLLSLLQSFWKIVMVAYALAMIANKLFGFDLSPLFASAGIIGIAIGFGSQSLVKDFLTGVFIIAENQYRVGDVVEIMGSSGTVERVGTRTTVVRDLNGNVHYIPNGTIQRVINKTMGYGITRFSIDIAAGADSEQAIKIINKIGEDMAAEEKWKKRIINPPKYDSLGVVSEKSIELIITGKTMPSDQWSVTREMRTRLLKALEEARIPIVNLPAADIAK